MATIIRRNMREWCGNCFGKWTISSKLKARYGGNIAFRVACKLQNRRCFGVGTWIPASSEAGRKVATSFARFFPSKEDYTSIRFQKPDVPGIIPIVKSLGSRGVANVISILDFRDGRRIDSKILPPSKLSRGSNFERILEFFPLATECFHSRIVPNACDRDGSAKILHRDRHFSAVNVIR